VKPAERVNPVVRIAASYSWRLLVIGALTVAVLWLIGQLLIVVIPVVVALLVTRVLLRPTDWLRARGLPPSLAAALSVLVFVAVVSLALVGVGASIAGELDALGDTVSEGVDDVERWLIDDSPFDISQTRLDELRSEAGSRVASIVESGGLVQSTAILGLEVVAGLLLSLIVTFFVLKDRRVIVDTLLRPARPERRHDVRRVGERAWATLGGYLRGVALLGVVEAVIIAGAVWLVGGGLVAAVAVITLFGAFVPIVGAIVAGIVAVLVTLVTAGPTAAIIVAVVAVVVQQLDNDLLAPMIYGKSLQLHPLVILLGVAAGSALFGIVGAVLAVPVISVAINSIDEWRSGSSSAADVEGSSVGAISPSVEGGSGA
jgi:predicted PurR-regulated permease PerM